MQDGGNQSLRYADFWLRFAAWLVDSAVLMIPAGFAGFCGGFIIGFALEYQSSPPSSLLIVLGIAGYLVGIAAVWLYCTLMESSSKQATLGKMALGLVVTDMDGNRITWGRANARYWSHIISNLTLMIGYIMAAFTEKKQALHDMIAGTLVLKG